MPGVGVSYMEERGVLLVERQYRLGPGDPIKRTVS